MAENQQLDDDFYEYVDYVNQTVYIIWGCVGGGLLIVFAVLIYICIRQKQNRDRRRKMAAVFVETHRNQLGPHTFYQPGPNQGVPAGYSQYPVQQGTQNPGYIGAVQPPFSTGGENRNQTTGQQQNTAFNRDQQGTTIPMAHSQVVPATGYSQYPHPPPQGTQNPGLYGAVNQPISSGDANQNQSLGQAQTAFGSGQAEAGPSNKY